MSRKNKTSNKSGNWRAVYGRSDVRNEFNELVKNSIGTEGLIVHDIHTHPTRGDTLYFQCTHTRGIFKLPITPSRDAVRGKLDQRLKGLACKLGLKPGG